MTIRPRSAVPGLLLSLLTVVPASAQILGGGNYTRPHDSAPINSGNIPRKTVHGSVKSLDNDKHTMLVTILGRDKKPVEMAIDVGPSLIFAGKGTATFADIHQGDPIKVWGEMTVQGGIRAMEITLPPERMSIPPPPKPQKHKKTKTPKPAPTVTPAAAPTTPATPPTTGRD